MGFFVWYETPEQAWGNMINDWATRVRMAIAGLLLSYVPRIEAWMKQNAPWTDRTGNLRQSLYADMNAINEHLFLLYWDYGLDYGRFLEFGHQGVWGITYAALDHFYPMIVADLQRILS
jgi:hypothetical protein